LKPLYHKPARSKRAGFFLSAEIFLAPRSQNLNRSKQVKKIKIRLFRQHNLSNPLAGRLPPKIFSRQGQEIFLRKILRSCAPLTIKNFGGTNQPRGLLKKCCAFFDFVNAHLRISPKGYAQA
jgi:hypothetical protein